MTPVYWATDRIAFGPEPDKKTIKQLVSSGDVTAFLCVRTSQDAAPLIQKAGAEYAAAPTTDENENKPPEWFLSCSSFIRASLSKPSGRIMVFCQHGERRSPSAVLFYLRSIGLDQATCTRLIYAANPDARGKLLVDDVESAIDKLDF